MNQTSRWRGVYVIVPTPFHADLSLDLEGLRETVRFCIACGAHGLVGPANASEQPYLSDEERRAVTRTLVEEGRGKAVVVAGVTAPTRLLAAELAREAEAMGADALMAMPPNMQRGTEAEIKEYFAAIDAAGSLPIFLQNYGGAGGTPMSPRLCAELLRDLPDVRFVKEETEFSSAMMTQIVEASGPALEGIMGGKAGRHLLDEHRRGACGTMPACEISDVHVALWNALEAGEEKRAREIYRILLPLLMFETGYGTAVYKEVLRRRGVIGCAAIRQTGGRTLDGYAMADLTAILDDLSPLMNPAYPVRA
ncbi:MAG TPA: dihydrodipicolinate synthase family protein [Acetobacteraceae bacterium]